jgi:hypothetical protein
MGLQISASGDVSYKVEDEEYRLDASELIEGQWVLNGQAQYKDDDEEWNVTWFAHTDHGTFTWLLNVTIGLNGSDIQDVWPTYPDGISEVEAYISFELQHS